MRYVYSVIRYVPDPARGEFVNVGAIVGSDRTGEWDVRRLDDMSAPADRLAGDGSTVSAVSDYIDEISQILDEYNTHGRPLRDGPPAVPSEGWLDQLYADHRYLVQLSKPAPTVNDSISQAADHIFEMLVAR